MCYYNCSRIIFENFRRTSFILGIFILCTFSTILLCFLMDTIEFPKLREPKPWQVSAIGDKAWLYPAEFPLLNLPRFKYLINNDVCQGASVGANHIIRAVLIITSHAGDVHVRSLRRHAFPFSELHRLQLRRVFLLATPTKNQTGYKYVRQEVIIEENNQFHDIIQGNFQEDYKNLSYKHAMGLKWAVTYCNSVKYIIKIDDDIAINIYSLLDILNKLDLQHAMAGYVLKGMQPDRGTSKWKVSFEEWPENQKYPTFLSGWLYATSPANAQKLVNALQTQTKIFWIDDILVSGIARQLAGVDFVDISQHFALHAERLYCCLEGYECNFVIAPSFGDWNLLERYLRYVASMRGQLKPKRIYAGHECVVTGNPNNVITLSQGGIMGQSKQIQLK